MEYFSKDFLGEEWDNFFGSLIRKDFWASIGYF